VRARRFAVKPAMPSLVFGRRARSRYRLLARALPGAAEAPLASAVRGGAVRVDGRVVREPGFSVAPGVRVAGELPGGKAPAFAPRLRLRGADFAVFETAPGALAPEAQDTALHLAALLDADPAQVLPVLVGDPEAHALWLVALGEAARLSARAVGRARSGPSRWRCPGAAARSTPALPRRCDSRPSWNGTASQSSPCFRAR
jgi:hypothetical protein